MSHTPSSLRSLRPFLSLGAACLALAACTPTVANRGNIIEPEKLAEVEVGQSSREDVAAKLGTPTSTGTFDENVWYYYGRHTEQVAFFEPTVISQEAVEIRFNDSGIVTSLQKLDSNDAKQIDPVSRRTPTYGHEQTYLEQLVGNLGSRSKGGGKDGKK